MTSSNQNTDYVAALSCGSLTVRDTIRIAPGSSEWKTYTPTISSGGVLGTGGATTFKYRIIGHTLEIQGSHTQTAAGTTGSSIYTIGLPSGAVPADASLVAPAGAGVIFGATKSYAVTALRVGNGVLLYISDPTSTTPAVAAWGSASDAEIRLGATAMSFHFHATIPLNVTSAILRA